MDKTITHADQRIIVLKMLLEVMHVFCGAYFKERKLAACADDLTLVAAIFVGQAEGRPLNASKLANQAGMARPTTIRKLARLQSVGMVERQGRGFVLCTEVTNQESVLMAAVTCRKIVVSAAEKLSKLDTKNIARR